ncbi:MAG TPA: hypothetical protein VM935_09705, partial [Chitinophagaceae bacterium]|nr:hypothetical protein [Chitinophagaceae bacterium]
ADHASGYGALNLRISGGQDGVCINRIGTYKLFGTYYSDGVTTRAPVVHYTADWQRDQPTITFTAVNVDEMKGNFEGTFYNGNDSMMINGTFKGDFVW